MYPQQSTTTIVNGDALDYYDSWAIPTVIISDGAYGVKGFLGDPPTPASLPDWYEPHIKAWSEKATPKTTLWFWNTEIGWATVHPLLEKYGWEYRACNIWDKGIAHIAGNSNTQSLRQLPIVTEVCVQYVKRAEFYVDGDILSMQQWLRYEWLRTGLPLSKTNEACGVKNAATRKYFTKDHLWYYPPPDAFEKIVAYANQYGADDGKPYFSVDGLIALTREEWVEMRSVFNCPIGITNVWQEPPLNGSERIKIGNRALHLNQKPLKFFERIIAMSSEVDDVVWEPFGGLCTAAVAAKSINRVCYSAEINTNIFEVATRRLDMTMRRLF